MFNSFKFELKKCISQKEFQGVFCFVILITLGAFWVSCFAFYGLDIRFVRSSADMTFNMGVYSSIFRDLLVILLPIVAGLVYSCSLTTEVNKNSIQYILTRESRKNCIVSKALVVIVVSFLLMFIPLLINMILCHITFPGIGFDNNSSLPPYAVGINNYDSSFWLDCLRVIEPNYFILVKIVAISIYSASFALLIYALSFIKRLTQKNNYLPVIIVFVIYTLAWLLCSMTNNDKFSIMNYLIKGSEGQTIIFIAYIVCINVISGFIIMFNSRRLNEPV